MKIGSILKAETLKEITQENLFPDAKGILYLERKYGDILKEEDLTGIKKENVIKKYLITTKNFSSSYNDNNSNKSQITKTIFNTSEDYNKNNSNNKGKNQIGKECFEYKLK